jgi:hypothetical protein
VSCELSVRSADGCIPLPPTMTADKNRPKSAQRHCCRSKISRISARFQSSDRFRQVPTGSDRFRQVPTLLALNCLIQAVLHVARRKQTKKVSARDAIHPSPAIPTRELSLWGDAARASGRELGARRGQERLASSLLPFFTFWDKISVLKTTRA